MCCKVVKSFGPAAGARDDRNRRDEQEMFVLCLRILQSVLVYVFSELHERLRVRGRSAHALSDETLLRFLSRVCVSQWPLLSSAA
jgi:hypothetical protein